MLKRSRPVRPSFGVLARLEDQRQHAHADKVGAMDALEALGDDGAHTQKQRALAAQSRELPVPYSLPARMTSGAFLLVALRGIEDARRSPLGMCTVTPPRRPGPRGS